MTDFMGYEEAMQPEADDDQTIGRIFPYRDLAAVTLSMLRQGEGVMPVDALQLQLADEGVAENRSAAYLSKLGWFGLVEVDESTVVLSGKGIGYVDKHADRIEEAYEVVRDRPEFPFDRYQLLSLLEADAKTRANRDETTPLLRDQDDKPLAKLVADQLGQTADVIAERLQDLQDDDLVNDEQNASKLTSAGTAELVILRDMFPQETTEEDHQYKLRHTILNMRAELRRMRAIVAGQDVEADPVEPEDPAEVFEPIKVLEKDEMSHLIGQLEIDMRNLEDIINDGNSALEEEADRPARRVVTRAPSPAADTASDFDPDPPYGLPPA